MTDAQIALYAAVRVAIPTSWRIRMVTSWKPGPGAMILVVCWRDRNHRREELRHAVPAEFLEDPRYKEGTIRLDVQQIVNDLGLVGAPAPE